MQLESWSDARPARDSNSYQKHSMEITAPAGQLELAQRLIRGIYQKEPILTDLSPEQLLQLLLLADRYEVPKVQASAAKALHAAPTADWPWQTVLDALSLPPSCTDQPSFKPVVNAAVTQLQQKLGDLEAVWADAELQQLLLGLPATALLQLLMDDNTCVTSEHTVVYTIMQWHQQQPVANRLIAQLKLLLQQVRMQHCSLHYINTVMMQDELVLKCFSIQELALASLCSSAAKDLQDADHPVLEQYPAWTAEKRPASAHPQIIDWKLPLDALKQLVEQHLADGEAAELESDVQVLQGQQLSISIEAAAEEPDSEASEASEDDSSDPGFALGVYLQLAQPIGACRQLTWTISAAVAAARKSWFTKGPMTKAGLAHGPGWGFGDFFGMSGARSWEDAVRVLQDEHLVHDDNSVHLRMELKSMQ